MSLAETLRTQAELSRQELDIQHADYIVKLMRKNAEEFSKQGHKEATYESDYLQSKNVIKIVQAKLEQDGFKVKIKYMFTSRLTVTASW